MVICFTDQLFLQVRRTGRGSWAVLIDPVSCGVSAVQNGRTGLQSRINFQSNGEWIGVQDNQQGVLSKVSEGGIFCAYFPPALTTVCGIEVLVGCYASWAM